MQWIQGVRYPHAVNPVKLTQYLLQCQLIKEQDKGMLSAYRFYTPHRAPGGHPALQWQEEPTRPSRKPRSSNIRDAFFFHI